jgi:hypothetical protein
VWVFPVKAQIELFLTLSSFYDEHKGITISIVYEAHRKHPKLVLLIILHVKVLLRTLSAKEELNVNDGFMEVFVILIAESLFRKGDASVWKGKFHT